MALHVQRIKSRTCLITTLMRHATVCHHAVCLCHCVPSRCVPYCVPASLVACLDGCFSISLGACLTMCLYLTVSLSHFPLASLCHQPDYPHTSPFVPIRVPLLLCCLTLRCLSRCLSRPLSRCDAFLAVPLASLCISCAA